MVTPNWNRWTTCGLLALGLGSACGDDGSGSGDATATDTDAATETSITSPSSSGPTSGSTSASTTDAATTTGQDTDPTAPSSSTTSDETGPPDNTPPWALNVNLPAYGLPAPTQATFAPAVFLDTATDDDGDPLSLLADRGSTVLNNPYRIDSDDGATVTFAPTGNFDEFEFTVDDGQGGETPAQAFPIAIAGVRLDPQAREFVIRCPEESMSCGHEVVNVGDVNGDGREDLALGWPGYDTENERGRVYVVFGRQDAAAIDLEDIDAGNGGFYIEGPSDNGGFGEAVGAAGDVNGDGFDDVAILNWDAHVIYGGATPTNTTAAQAVTDGAGFRISRNTPFGDFYLDVDAVGDVNDDGADDFVIGAVVNDAGSHTHAYLVWGGDLAGTLTQASLESGTNGIWFRDDLPDNANGTEVAVQGVGDVNGDDLPDFALARSPNVGPVQGYIAFGRAAAGVVNLTELVEGVDGVTFGTDETGNVESLAALVDFGGPGVPGIAIGQADHGGSDGRVVVVTDFTARVDLDTDGIHFSGIECRSGIDVAEAGDANGDGRGDLLIAQVCVPDLDDDGLRTNVAYATDTDEVVLSNTVAGEIGHVFDYPTSDVDPEYGMAGTKRMGRIDFDGDGSDETFLADPRRGVVHLVID